MDITIYRDSVTILDIEISRIKLIESFNKNIINTKTLTKYDIELKKVKGVLVEYLESLNEHEIIEKIKEHNIYKQLISVVGVSNAKRLIKLGITCLLFVALNGVSVLADESITKAATEFDAKMSEVFVLIAVIGGWFLVIAAAIEIGTSLYKGNKENVIGIVVKYILIYISMLLMPTIIKFTRKLVLGW